mmetsp:Transcript_7437/g.20392  ORF Transcript_7437/g.20392 Transcript_7437/m.20392 type:complete len:230 (+) Transcript_7437:656-1345(+)
MLLLLLLMIVLSTRLIAVSIPGRIQCGVNHLPSSRNNTLALALAFELASLARFPLSLHPALFVSLALCRDRHCPRLFSQDAFQNRNWTLVWRHGLNEILHGRGPESGVTLRELHPWISGLHLHCENASKSMRMRHQQHEVSHIDYGEVEIWEPEIRIHILLASPDILFAFDQKISVGLVIVFPPNSFPHPLRQHLGHAPDQEFLDHTTFCLFPGHVGDQLPVFIWKQAE